MKHIKIHKDAGITKGIDNYNKFYKKALDPVRDRLKTFSEKNSIKY